MKHELGGQIIRIFVGLRAKTYSYLKDNNDEDKEVKDTKTRVIKRRLKFHHHKNYLEAVQNESKINHLGKTKIEVDRLKEDKKEFIKNSKLMLKTQQRFRGEKHNLFVEEINKISLSSNMIKGYSELI